MPQQQDSSQSDNSLLQGLGLAGGGTLVGGGIIAAILAPQYRNAILIFLLVAIILVALGLGIFFLVRARRRKKLAEKMADETGQSLDDAAASHDDLEVKARLERVKRKFMDLIATLRNEGTSIYDLPWFLTLGPSGSGKSWVLKGAGLDPLGNEPWKGGTFLIDWWTCSKAIVLDTAGGVVFHEEKGYETPEWARLLDLLKKHRPQCPISGVLVMVPAQLLWLRDDELPEKWLKLDEYASALRLQLRKKLQRDLGVRFPVYIVVTQTDRVPGFREFTEALEDNGKPKGQMVGWSLPVMVGQQPRRAGGNGSGDSELDQIKALDESLHQVASDLRRQRLLLLRKYVGEGARADELGMTVRRRAADLFAFPDALQSVLAPRIKELVEKVFKPGDPTLPKTPPFLRGIYFTSSMREGEVLDRARAGGVGRALATLALPGGADDAQPNPFFLKDLIESKVFPEQGLVMPLRQAGAFLAQRRRWLIWSGVAAGLVLLLAIGLGGYSYQRSVGDELSRWQQAQRAAQDNPTNYWLPVLSGTTTSAHLDSVNLKKQVDLAVAANGRLQGGGFWSLGWLFGMHKLDVTRRQAQLHLFERGVIWPLADLARQKLLQSTKDPNPPDQAHLADERGRFEAALCAVLELELNNEHLKGPELEASRDRVLGGLVPYVLAGSTADASAQVLDQFKSLFNLTYQHHPEAWPPARYRQPELLPAIVETAFRRLQQLQATQADLFSSERNHLRSLVADTGDFQKQEADFLTEIENRDTVENLTDKLNGLQTGWQKLSRILADAQVPLFRSAFTNYALKVKTSAEEGQSHFRERLLQVNGAHAGSNLIPILAAGFTNLAGDIPPVETTLKHFNDLFEQADVLDATVLTNRALKAAGPEDASAPPRVIEQRFALYQRVLSLPDPSTRQYERSLFEEGADAKDVLDTFSKSTGQVCEGYPLALCAGLTNGTDSYESILRQYLEYRQLAALLRAADKATEKALSSEDFIVEVNDFRTPATMLNETGDRMRRVKKIESAWSALKERWKSLGGREVLNRRSAERLNETRQKLVEAITTEIQTEEIGPKKFPLVAQADTALSESELRKYHERAKRWLDTLQNTPADAKFIAEETRAEWVRAIQQDWIQQRLDRLVDDDGNIRDYEIGTPWGKYSEAFKSFLRGNQHDFEAAKDAAGTYRYWTIEGKQLDASDPDNSRQVNAYDGFGLEAKGKSDAVEQIATPPRNDAWSIISMLNRAGQPQRGTYFVPIEVRSPGQQSAQVWFVVRPVAAKAQH